MTDTSGNPGRWERDPSGLHEYRWWDGTAWTDHVSDRGVQGVDPLPPYPGPAAVAYGQAGYGQAGHGQAGAGTMVGPHYGVRRDPTAVMGRRYGAFFLDAAIVLVVFFVVFFAVAERRTVGETLLLPDCRIDIGTDQVECDNRVVVQIGDTVYETNAVVALTGIGFTFLYFAVFEGVTGATLGKRATGLRVVKEDGRIQGLGAGVVRWLLFAVDGPLTLYLCGIITSATSRGHRRLGDMAAKTYVVGSEDAGAPIVV